MRRLLPIFLLATAACSGATADRASARQLAADGSIDDAVDATIEAPTDTLPTPEQLTATTPTTVDIAPDALFSPDDRVEIEVEPATAAVIDDDGQIGFVRDGRLTNDLFKFRALPALDGKSAALTVGRHTGRTYVNWLSLPDGEFLGAKTITGELEATATDLVGDFTAFVSYGDERVDGAIEASRTSSRIVITSPDVPGTYAIELDGNFVPEAFGTSVGKHEIPSQLYLLEYLPADAPQWYRVRILRTETGELSYPVNLRNKTQLVDQQMAGYTRGQVVSAEDGMLFTLYIGTNDMPEGHPHAFVHTLAFDGGVWCLAVDEELELDRLPGSLAVSDDRLYVASANGKIGAFDIASIPDPRRQPVMEWVTEALPAGEDSPVVLADDDGVLVGNDTFGTQLMRVRSDGRLDRPRVLPGAGATALAAGGDGSVHAIGEGWSTIGLAAQPDWLDTVTNIYVGD